jgi:hypothetical protein
MLEHAQSEPEAYGMPIDNEQASLTLDALMVLVSDLLPVERTTYPEVPVENLSDTVTFCLRHSALHFSKTAGKLASFVEDADHGRFASFQTLESIVAASLVNSLKLADEIGLSGSEIIDAVRLKFAALEREG